MAASDLPVMVDGDNGYGDVKNIVHVLHGYERLGVSAIMFEDQVAPKRCGHIAGKDVIPAAEMAAKIRAVGAEKTTATPSSWRAPTRATCWASTRRSAAPSNISRPAPTASSSSRRTTSPSSS